MTQLWRVIFLAEKYGRLTLTLDEVAEQIGLAAATIRTRRSRDREFQWLKADGRSLYADVADVAEYLERRRSAEPDAPKSTAPTADSQKQLLTIGDIAARFGVTRRNVAERWVADPGFPRPRYAPTKRTRLWEAKDVECWAASAVRPRQR